MLAQFLRFPCFLALFSLVSSAAETITSLRHLKQIPNSMASGPVDLTAQVTLYSRIFGVLILQQDGVGAYANAKALHSQSLTLGDWVHVQGQAEPGGFSPIVRITSLNRKGPGTLPKPLDFTSDKLRNPDLENLWGTVRVTVTQIRENEWPPRGEHVLTMTLLDKAGLRFNAYWFGRSLEEVRNLAGAEVEITAVIGSEGNGYGQEIGPSILMGEMAHVRTLKPGRTEWNVSKVTIGRILTYGAGNRVGDRVRCEGVVTYLDASDGSFYLDDGSGAALIWPVLRSSLTVGQSIEVTGVLAREGDRFGLSEGQSREAPAHHITPIRITSKQLNVYWFGGRLIEALVHFWSVERRNRISILSADLDGQPITIEGVDWTGKSFMPGDLLLVRGVAEFRRDLHQIQMLRVLARSFDDVTMLKPAPWWRRVPWAVISAVTIVLLTVSLIRNALMRRYLKGIVAERARVARELHDTVLQGFSGLALHLEAIRNAIPQTSESLRSQVSRVLSQMEVYLEDARSSIVDLRRISVASVAFTERIRHMIEQQTAKTEVKHDYRIEGTAKKLPRPVEEQLYRLASEAVVNALRHAQCRHLFVTLKYLPMQAVLTVKDDGIGFNVKSVLDVETSHFGLRGMRERTRALNGDLVIESSPGNGTSIRFSLPTS